MKTPNAIQQPVRWRLHVWLLCVLLVSFIALPVPSRLNAQTEASWITVTGIDTASFPQVSVTVYGEGLGGDLADAEIQIYEDGEEQEVTSSYDAVGIQLALVLDAANNISGPGQTGATRIEEVRNAVTQLTQERLLLQEVDWLTAIAYDNVDGVPKPVVLAPWSTDHQAVLNAIYTHEPNPSNVFTPLNEQILFAIDQFKNEVAPQNLQRHIVVFSDGPDTMSVRQGDDIAREVEPLDIRIHTVQIGVPVGEGRRNLQYIAAITGGKFYPLDTQDPLLDGLWRDITASQYQRTFTYRSSRPDPQQITAQVVTADGARLRDSKDFAPLLVRPPVVEIVSPEVAQIVRGSQDTAYNAPLADLLPNQLEVGIETSWQDRHPRQIRSIEYTINGSVRATTAGDVTSATLAIADLDSGTYTIRVRATDELGLVGESPPLTFEMAVLRQPTPDVPATVDAQATVAADTAAAVAATATASSATAATATATAQSATATAVARAEGGGISDPAPSSPIPSPIVPVLPWAIIASTVFSFFALIFAVAAWRSPRVRRRATEVVSNALKKTKIWSPAPNSKKKDDGTAKARLTLVQGDPALPATIDLLSGSTRLGRDPALVNVMLDDRRISRYHCRIAEEASGAFRIWDEGSMSGTFVNQQQVAMSGNILQPGDIIQIGPASYEFQPLSRFTADTTVAHDGMYIEATEPFIPVAANQTTQTTTPPPEDSHDDVTQIEFPVSKSGEVDSSTYLIDDEDQEDDGFYKDDDSLGTNPNSPFNKRN